MRKTTTVGAAAALDPAAVASRMETLGVHPIGRLPLEVIGGGRSNFTCLVTDEADGSWVLRQPPAGPLLSSAHDVAREHRVLAALQNLDVPTPAVFGLSAPQGETPLLVMEHVEGLVVGDIRIASRLTPGLRRAVGLSMVDALVQLHAVDPDRVGLGDLAAPTPYAERQIKRWRRQWEESRTRELDLVTELADRLAAAIPPQQEVVVVHGDYHLLNVLVDSEVGRVKAILDWELCTLGDPLADVGGMLAYWSQPDEDMPTLMPACVLRGFPTRAELTQRYAEKTGRSLEGLGFWRALAMWKIGVIFEGIRRRALDRVERGEPVQLPSVKDIDSLFFQASAMIEADVGRA